MTFSYTLPSRLKAAVESMLRTSFCEVPALSRVEPVRISGPVFSSIPTREAATSSLPLLLLTPMVAHPASEAFLTAATT